MSGRYALPGVFRTQQHNEIVFRFETAKQIVMQAMKRILIFRHGKQAYFIRALRCSRQRRNHGFRRGVHRNYSHFGFGGLRKQRLVDECNGIAVAVAIYPGCSACGNMAQFIPERINAN